MERNVTNKKLERYTQHEREMMKWLEAKQSIKCREYLEYLSRIVVVARSLRVHEKVFLLFFTKHDSISLRRWFEEWEVGAPRGRERRKVEIYQNEIVFTQLEYGWDFRWK